MLAEKDTGEAAEARKEPQRVRTVLGYLLGGLGGVLIVSGLAAMFLSPLGDRDPRTVNWNWLGYGMLAGLVGYAMVRVGRCVLPKDTR